MTYDTSNTKFGKNNNPTHFIVLDAIGRGINDIDKIAKTTRLPREEVELIINDLSSQRLIIKEEKKRRFFGGKKVETKVTETGLKMLNSKKQELEEQAQQLRQWQSNGNTTQLQSYMNSNRSWIPFMLFSGIMDVLFFTSMMSMMGMAMNPMESQMAGESGAAGDTAGGSETGGEDSSQIGEADTSGDFGGFDAGGFGDF
jgi:hypothetical protein